jgi:hypothetical protein
MKRFKTIHPAAHILHGVFPSVRVFLNNREVTALSALGREWTTAVGTYCLCVGRLGNWTRVQTLYGWLHGCTFTEVMHTLNGWWMCTDKAHVNVEQAVKRELAYTLSCCSGCRWEDISTLLHLHPETLIVHWDTLMSRLPRVPTEPEVTALISDTVLNVDTRFMLWSHKHVQLDASVKAGLVKSRFLSRADAIILVVPDLCVDIVDLVVQYASMQYAVCTMTDH